MPDSISREEVAHVANLARLRLSDDELDHFTEQLGAVLAHAADIASLDVAGVEPTSHPFAMANVTRPDEPSASLRREDVLAEAPASEDGQFRVPPVLGEAP